ncbi:MAG: EpsI family protein [Pirellula sp.]
MTVQRVTLLIVMFLVSFLAVGWFKARISAEGEVPNFKLSNLPLVLGKWSGEEMEIMDETVQVMKAHDFINRLYFDDKGRRILLHVAIWVNDGQISPAPHHPTICFPAAGWSIINRSYTEFLLEGNNRSMELIKFQKDGTGVVTGHWYELGKTTFTTSEGFFKQRVSLMGSRRWPFSVKFLLQTDAATIEQAEPVIRDFAEVVREAFRELIESSSESNTGEELP